MRPDVIVILTDQERAAPSYETDALRDWRDRALPGRRWFAELVNVGGLGWIVILSATQA